MKKIICLLGVLLVAGPVFGKSLITGNIAHMPDQAVSVTPTFDVSNVSRLSIQVNYTSSTILNVPFTEGSKSIAQITVANNTFVQSSTPTILINGVSVPYTPGATASLTASSISSGIINSASLNTIVTSSFSSAQGVVFATSTGVGQNAYSITSSSWMALAPSNSIFTGGFASNLDGTSDVITATNTYGTGQGAYLSVGAGSAPTGLASGTTYFIIPVSIGRTFKLATSAANAVAGTVIDISTTAAGGGVYTLTATTVTTGAAYTLQGSNDGINWATLPSTGAVAVGNPSGVSTLLYDGQFLNVKFFRMNYTKPNAGGLDVDIWVQGKNDE